MDTLLYKVKAAARYGWGLKRDDLLEVVSRLETLKQIYEDRGTIKREKVLDIDPLSLPRITLEDIIASKQISPEKRKSEIQNLKDWDASHNVRSFIGNKFLYHFQIENLCRTRFRKADSLSYVLTNDNKYATLYRHMLGFNRTGSLANRLFEAYRFINPIVIFRSTTAKFLYREFGATSVLDPCAGWGGRMLGAHAQGIKYMGLDTNLSLKPSYEQMLVELNDPNLTMVFADCREVDFSKVEYDMVLTSPPYFNVEVYEYMPMFDNLTAYITGFLAPLIDQCLAHVQGVGKVCINIAPDLYQALMDNGYPPCDKVYDLLQQARLGRASEEKIYIWERNNA